MQTTILTVSTGPWPLWPQQVAPHHSTTLCISNSLHKHLHAGYGDLSATNVREMIYAIAVMVAGKLIFGFILGSIASTLANMDTQRVLFEEKINALKVKWHL